MKDILSCAWKENRELVTSLLRSYNLSVEISKVKAADKDSDRGGPPPEENVWKYIVGHDTPGKGACGVEVTKSTDSFESPAKAFMSAVDVVSRYLNLEQTEQLSKNITALFRSCISPKDATPRSDTDTGPLGFTLKPMPQDFKVNKTPWEEWLSENLNSLDLVGSKSSKRQYMEKLEEMRKANEKINMQDIYAKAPRAHEHNPKRELHKRIELLRRRSQK